MANSLHILRRLTNTGINLLFWLCILFVFYVALRIFVFSSFKIPSDSMEPELRAGDHILVFKPLLGARLLNPFAAMKGEKISIQRLPGFRNIRHNDVVVFNFPYTGKWDSIRMDIKTYYVKRCIGLPGDSLSIRNGFYQVNGQRCAKGCPKAQAHLANQPDESIEKEVLVSFPYDTLHPWTIKEFGPLYIPKAGDKIRLTAANISLYKRLVEWEQGKKIKFENERVYLEGKEVGEYCFEKDYYFMAGDQVEDSKDSRYWGVLPEEFIVGKVSLIWKSENGNGTLRWERFLKSIN